MNLLEQVTQEYKSNGYSTQLITLMKELRETFKEAGDPTVTKTLRLAYQHIEENNDFKIDILEERTENDQPSFEFFLELLKDPRHEFNREDIQDYKYALLGKEREVED